MIATYLAYSLANLFKPENTSQFQLTKDQNPIRRKDLLLNTSLPVLL